MYIYIYIYFNLSLSPAVSLSLHCSFQESRQCIPVKASAKSWAEFGRIERVSAGFAFCDLHFRLALPLPTILASEPGSFLFEFADVMSTLCGFHFL